MVGGVTQRHEDEVAILCDAVVETRIVVVFSNEVSSEAGRGGEGGSTQLLEVQ